LEKLSQSGRQQRQVEDQAQIQCMGEVIGNNETFPTQIALSSSNNGITLVTGVASAICLLQKPEPS